MRKLLFVLISVFITASVSAQSIFETVIKPHDPYGSNPFEGITDMAFQADSSLRLITRLSADIPGNNSAIHYYNSYHPLDSVYQQSHAGYWFGPDADFTQETYDPVKGNKILLEADVNNNPLMVSRHRFHEFIAPDSSRWFQKDRLPGAINVQLVEGKLMSVYHPHTNASNWVRQRSDTLQLALIDLNQDSLVDQQDIYLPFVPQEVGVFFYQNSDSLLKLTYDDTTFVYKLGNPNLIRTETNSTFSDLDPWARFHALTSGRRLIRSNDTTREITLRYFDRQANQYEVTLAYHGDSSVNYYGAYHMRHDSTVLAVYSDTTLRLNDTVNLHIFEYDRNGQILNRYDLDPDYSYLRITNVLETKDGLIYLGGSLRSTWETPYSYFTSIPYFAVVDLNGPISVKGYGPDKLTFSIFPTLANQYLTLKTDSRGPHIYEVFNAAGQILLIGKVGSNASINVQPLPAGLYHFRLKSHAGQINFMKY